MDALAHLDSVTFTSESMYVLLAPGDAPRFLVDLVELL